MENSLESFEKPVKPKLRWYQFSLRSLLISVTLVAIACSWFAMKMQRDAIATYAEQRCPVCGRAVVAVEQVKDDDSKPSRNLAVWNRSSCGNPLFGTGSKICLHDWYAYSAFSKEWELSLEDPKGFASEMDQRIRDLTLPEKSRIRSRVVYSQSIDGERLVHSVSFWCDTDQLYLDRLEKYAKRAGVNVKIEHDKIPEQTYASAEVETKPKQNNNDKP